jgi:hypothetical protein
MSKPSPHFKRWWNKDLLNLKSRKKKERKEKRKEKKAK